MGSRKRPLLLFLAPADHPHRDAACATLAWLAEGEGLLFECYFGGPASGAHAGGGHPASHQPADLRGGPPGGGHHLEALYLLLRRFDVTAVCLGPSIFDAVLIEAGVERRATAPGIAAFYQEVFAGSTVAHPNTLLVVGDGGRPEGVSLGAYAYPEIVTRRVLAISDGDPEAVDGLRPGMTLDSLWLPAEVRRGWRDAGVELDASAGEPREQSVAAQTLWMAARHPDWDGGALLADPELAGRWTPTASRRRWLPIYGFPQWKVMDEVGPHVADVALVHGRQQDDRDFLELSRRGHSLQLIDPGRPPFPVLAEAPGRWQPTPASPAEPSDAQLDAWAAEDRVLSSLLFWAGMIRELETLYALTDILGETQASAGLILSTESFRCMSEPPLALLNTPADAGGLLPRVEALIASGGAGTFLESMAPEEVFTRALQGSMADLLPRLADTAVMPRGWWAVMDAPFVPHRQGRVGRRAEGWPVRVRYRPRGAGGDARAAAGAPRRDLRARVRDSRLSDLFDPVRPFDMVRPGSPDLNVLRAVRAAGFEYAFTKSGFGGRPRVFTGVEGLTVLNETAGRWDGWTPFVTVGSIADLRRAETRLLREGAGWLVGTLDSCLWALSGPILSRGAELRDMCAWLAAGGDSGRLVNVTPRTVARYARLLNTRQPKKVALAV